MGERGRLLAMAREEYEKDRSIKEIDIQELVDEMINSYQIPEEGDRKHFHKTAYTFDNENIYNHYKKKYREFREHCQFITEGRTEIHTPLYRGTKVKRDFKIGRNKFTGVASWSKDVEVAQDFGDTVYILEGPKWATSLNEYSLYPSEKEFLVTSNIQVEVKDISHEKVHLFGRVNTKKYIRFQVVEEVHLRRTDGDSGFSESDTSDVEKRASFLPDGPASSDDFQFHQLLLGNRNK